MTEPEPVAPPQQGVAFVCRRCHFREVVDLRAAFKKAGEEAARKISDDDVTRRYRAAAVAAVEFVFPPSQRRVALAKVAAKTDAEVRAFGEAILAVVLKPGEVV